MSGEDCTTANSETIELQIRAILDSESDAITLSNKLFGPNGLFSRLASDKAQRRIVAQSPLFREAQQRLAQLRLKDARQFSKAVEQAQHVPVGNSPQLLKIERV